jgi:hypothetical protein
VGQGHTVAVRQDGTLWAWGRNDNGQLGNGQLNNGTTGQTTPIQIGTATTWKQVAAGYGHTLAVRTDGSLWAWGSNYDGQLGTNGPAQQLTPVQVGTATTWQSVMAREGTSAALRQDGSLWAWGNNRAGQLGTSTTTTQRTPLPVGTGATWQQVALGNYFTLAIRADGALWGWGDNAGGQLGYSPANPVPVYIPMGGTPLAATSAATAAAWQLAPNPAHGRAQLHGLPAGPVAGRLFDAQGRLVRTTTSAEVGLMGLAPGLYLLRAAAGGTSRTLRLVVE